MDPACSQFKEGGLPLSVTEGICIQTQNSHGAQWLGGGLHQVRCWGNGMSPPAHFVLSGYGHSAAHGIMLCLKAPKAIWKGRGRDSGGRWTEMERKQDGESNTGVDKVIWGEKGGEREQLENHREICGKLQCEWRMETHWLREKSRQRGIKLVREKKSFGRDRQGIKGEGIERWRGEMKKRDRQWI